MAEDLERLAQRLRSVGSDPNVIYLHPKAVAWLQLIERRRQHWYWRLWWRIRYAPADLRDWVRRQSNP